jgi:hypothetical protein
MQGCGAGLDEIEAKAVTGMLILPDSYFFAMLAFACASIIGLFRLNAPWGVPYIAAVLTVGAWYLIEPVYFSHEFESLDLHYVESAFDNVALFFAAFSLITPILVHEFGADRARRPAEISISPERILTIAATIWAVLLAYGVMRVQGDIMTALFPLAGRWKGDMWGRAGAASAGVGGFIVSSAGYLYSLMLASFGVLFFMVRKNGYRAFALALILVSWPYAFLQGTRNETLFVVVPGIMYYVLFFKSPKIVKALIVVPIFLALEFVLRVIIAYRDVGFENVQLSRVQATQHLGLNMASELVHSLSFVDHGVMRLSYGGEYLQELMNFIPRAIWPDKPLLGIDYSIARGFGNMFGGAANDTGVVATVAPGLIGQGVLNFGPLLGAIVAAILMGLWVAFLARLRAEGSSLRVILFLLGLGLTFNLGRDITLLVLWPIVFGYIGVRFLEHVERKRVNSRQRVQRHLRPPIGTTARGLTTGLQSSNNLSRPRSATTPRRN